MFDLNEIPEHLQPQETVPGALEDVVDHSEVEKDQTETLALASTGAGAATQTASASYKPLDLLSTGRSLASMLSVEHSSILKRPFEDSSSPSTQVSRKPEKPDEASRRPHKAVVASTDVVHKDEYADADLLGSGNSGVTTFTFIATAVNSSSSVSKKQEVLHENSHSIVDDDPKNSSLKQRNSIKPENSPFNLSLGGSSTLQRSPGQNRHGDAKPYFSTTPTTKNTQFFDLALGRTKETPLTWKKINVVPFPFWRGKLRTDAPLLTPVLAYCLCEMKPDSRLKKLPAILSSHKFIKMEEFQKLLRNGVAEPPVLFRPTFDASTEEVKRFYLMVEALSHGTPFALDLVSKNRTVDTAFPYTAALAAWEDDNYSPDAKLYLISSLSFHELHKKLFGYSEDIDALDSEALYGLFCYNSPAEFDNISSRQLIEKDAIRNSAKSLTEGVDGTPSPTAQRAINSGNSPLLAATNHSRSKGLGSRTEFLTKSASLEPIRSSNRDGNSRYDYEESERGSKKHYHKQLSSIDLVHETDGKRHSRYTNDPSDLYEEDIIPDYPSKQRDKFNWNYGRLSQKNDWRRDSLRWSRDERDSSKSRTKDYHRHSYHESERGWKSRPVDDDDDGGGGVDKSWHKLRERTMKEDSKPGIEKHLAGSKGTNGTFHHHRGSPDNESGKSTKKREREVEEETTHLKRAREPGLSSLLESVEALKDSNSEPKIKPGIEKFDVAIISEKDLESSGKPPASELSIDPLTLNEKAQTNQERHDSILLSMNNTETHNLEITKPVFEHGRFNGDMCNTTELNRASVTETESVSDVDTSFNMPKLHGIQDGMMEDGVSLKWCESPFTKGDKEEKEELASEFLLDVSDKETRTWLMSKQNAVYLQEEHGVNAIINSEVAGLNPALKADPQNSPLQVRISMTTSESCDAAEARWFLDQAVSMVKSIAIRGVFSKCIWYEGPVQIQSGDGSPSVPVIVKKIKGDDGKNLERIQDETGVMIGVVLRKGGVTAQDSEPMSRARFIGLRLKSVRRKGLLEASQKAESLLESVAEHFAKELENHISTHTSDLQEASSNPSESLPDPTIITKELLPNSPVKHESPSSTRSSKLDVVTCAPHDIDHKVSEKATAIREDADANLPSESNVAASRPLYVSNLPENVTSGKIRNIFETVLKEKLQGSSVQVEGSEFVTDVRYIPDKYCAFVELSNDDLLSSSLKLYAEDKNVFHGLSIELGLSPNSKSDRQNSFSRSTARNRIINNLEQSRSFVSRTKGENHGRRQYENESDSDYSHELWYSENVASRSDNYHDKPRPLFLSELMRNASGQTIKQLFEDIITTYIGPSLVSSSGRQLVLDVRYVPSRGCAFVDLATPELVEFMLDLHSRRPEVFLNMKMELGRRPVPYSAEDDVERRLSMRNREGIHGKSQYSSQLLGYHLTALGSRKKLDKRSSGSYNDFLDDSDKDDLRQGSRVKRLRSDPEKTVYADRLPESANEGMIRKIFERVLLQNLTREELAVFGEQLITEVRHVPSKYCAFVVFASEDLTKIVLQMYTQDEDAFESMRLKPHFHSRMEDLYSKDEQNEIDSILHSSGSFRERALNPDDDFLRPRADLQEQRGSRSAARAIAASAFKEVDRRRSVYVDRIPEDLSEYAMTEMFEKVFRHKKKHHDSHMVSQVAYFRDKFDPSKLCAFVELKTDDCTQDLVDYYNANPDAFQGVRVRPGFKYNN